MNGPIPNPRLVLHNKLAELGVSPMIARLCIQEWLQQRDVHSRIAEIIDEQAALIEKLSTLDDERLLLYGMIRSDTGRALVEAGRQLGLGTLASLDEPDAGLKAYRLHVVVDESAAS